MTISKQSPCKINLLLNILGQRPDGFHELETVLHPINVCDELTFKKLGREVHLTCSNPELPTDNTNLVYRAAMTFQKAAQTSEGIQIHLEKRIPLAAGLGGGSGNAATTLLGLNELFGHPLSSAQLHELASALGSDIPFFLQSKPALATGRGEQIHPLDFFPALQGAAALLIYPGFGVATAWAYQQLPRYPAELNGQPGRAKRLIETLQTRKLSEAVSEFYNALEAPALVKYPILAIIQDFLRANGAAVALMSGSGSTTFAIFHSEDTAREAEAKAREKFGACWTQVVQLPATQQKSSAIEKRSTI